MSGPSVAQALAEAKAMGLDRLDAQLLLARALACTRSWLLAHDDATLAPPQASRFRAEAARRSAGEPLAYVLGEKEFHGLALQVNPSVLVPRPETEVLVDWALEVARGALAQVHEPRVLDLGTGSGAIALAVKNALPKARVSAVDVSVEALALAGLNAQRLKLDVAFQRSHWWDGLGGQPFHLVVSNPPYIRADDPHLHALGHEPPIALVSGPEGLDALAAIIMGAASHLEPGGWLLLEHGHDQAAQVQSLLCGSGFVEPRTRLDLAGLPRCTGARR